MKNKSMKLPVLIIAIGLVLTILVSVVTCVARIPTITEHDFKYSATYKLNGETKTVEGVYRCRFVGETDRKHPVFDRYYEASYLSDNSVNGGSEHVIETKDDLDFCVVFIFTADYLMGDGELGEKYEDVVSEPYLAAFDKNEGYEYSDYETLEKFDAQLVSWELPEAIENSFVFSHITGFSHKAVYPTLFVAILTLIAIIIFVKRQEQSERKSVDMVSLVLNFVVAATLLPFVTVAAVLIDINGVGTEFYYQIFYFFPAFLAFSITASVALRRRGRGVKSLVAQLVGPVVFGIFMLVCAAFGLL